MQKIGLTFTILTLLCLGPLESLAQNRLQGTASIGRRLFHSPALSSNGLACINCHADFDEERAPDGLIRSGHSLYNAARRDNWWGKDSEDMDAYPDISTAAIVCVIRYQRNATKKLTAQQMLNLQAYLEAITRRPTSVPLAITPGADKTREYAGFSGGNRHTGRDLFYAACHTCHPNGNKGIGPTLPRKKDPAFYAKKIREGDGLGAVLAGIDPNAYDQKSGQFMPFFGADRLSKEQIRHIIAYIKSLSPPGK
jgi:mono/diheme cytochrome c family protein